MTRFKSKLMFAGIAVLFIVAAAGCGSDEQPPLPAADAADLWAFLQEADYQNQWDLWPGTTERFVGQEPHGDLHTVYANNSALDAVGAKSGVLPNGAIVVKDNFTSAGVYEVSTIMFKVEGFDAENNNWFWAMISPTGEIRNEGKIAGCNACHGTQVDNDYIWIGPLK